MALETLIPLRPVMLERLYLEGEPFTAASEREQKRHLETKRFRVATKEDLEAWKTRLKLDPVLAANALAQATKPEAPDSLKSDAAAKGGRAAKGEADAKAKAEADAKAKAEADAKAEAEEKEKADAEAKAKVEADSKPGASIGPGGIG